MLEFPCPECGARLRLPEEQAGPTAQCPSCKMELSLPTPPLRSQAITADPLARSVLPATAITTRAPVIPPGKSSSNVPHDTSDTRASDTARRPTPGFVYLCDALLVAGGVAYPLLQILILGVFVGAMGLLRIENFYLFSFVLPGLVVAAAFVARSSGALQFHWLAFVGFAAWMALIGYLTMQLFFAAWEAV